MESQAPQKQNMHDSIAVGLPVDMQSEQQYSNSQMMAAQSHQQYVYMMPAQSQQQYPRAQNMPAQNQHQYVYMMPVQNQQQQPYGQMIPAQFHQQHPQPYMQLVQPPPQQFQQNYPIQQQLIQQSSLSFDEEQELLREKVQNLIIVKEAELDKIQTNQFQTDTTPLLYEKNDMDKTEMELQQDLLKAEILQLNEKLAESQKKHAVASVSKDVMKVEMPNISSETVQIKNSNLNIDSQIVYREVEGRIFIVHNVKINDTLTMLSLKYGVSVKQIQAANLLIGDSIFQKRELLIPVKPGMVLHVNPSQLSDDQKLFKEAKQEEQRRADALKMLSQFMNELNKTRDFKEYIPEAKFYLSENQFLFQKAKDMYRADWEKEQREFQAQGGKPEKFHRIKKFFGITQQTQKEKKQ